MKIRKGKNSRITIGEIRALIRETFRELKNNAGSSPEETYDKLLTDDPSYNKQSEYVPDDIKDDIKKWMSVMGLNGHKYSR